MTTTYRSKLRWTWVFGHAYYHAFDADGKSLCTMQFKPGFVLNVSKYNLNVDPHGQFKSEKNNGKIVFRAPSENQRCPECNNKAFAND